MCNNYLTMFTEPVKLSQRDLTLTLVIPAQNKFAHENNLLYEGSKH